MPPVVSFFHYTPYRNIRCVTFNASDCYVVNDTIVRYEWNFGDGKITVLNHPVTTHVYANVGNYTVILNVTSGHGLWNTAATEIMIQLVGDANEDGAVDIFDIIIVAMAIDSSPGDPH